MFQESWIYAISFRIRDGRAPSALRGGDKIVVVIDTTAMCHGRWQPSVELNGHSGETVAFFCLRLCMV